MFMPSAQRWADNQCCRCIPSCPDFKTPISGDCFDLTVQDVGICGVNCCILVTYFVHMAIYESTWKYTYYFTLFRCLKIVFLTFLYF